MFAPLSKLKGIRKKKLEAEYAVNKELSGNLNVKGLGGVNEELFDWPQLNDDDQSRIDTRASKLAKPQEISAVISHLKHDEYERLKPSLNGMHIIVTKGEYWADEVAAQLHEEMPWMGIDFHTKRYVAASKRPS